METRITKFRVVWDVIMLVPLTILNSANRDYNRVTGSKLIATLQYELLSLTYISITVLLLIIIY